MLRAEYRIRVVGGQLIIQTRQGTTSIWLVGSEGRKRLIPLMVAERRQLSLPFGRDGAVASLHHLVAQCASRVLSMVSQFTEHEEQLLALCFNAGVPAVEMLEDCPALAFLIATRIESTLRPEEYQDNALALLRRKRHHLLGHFAYPATKQAARLMRKIPPGECSNSLMQHFQCILRQGGPKKIKLLSHLGSINRLVLHALCTPLPLQSLFGMRFYEDASRLNDPERMQLTGDLLREIQRLLEAGPVEPGRLVRINSLHALDAVHEQVVQQLTERNWVNDRVRHMILPFPPLSPLRLDEEDGTNYGIFPLDSNWALWSEGVAMHHCIASYLGEIQAGGGRLYAYHVALPGEQPATVLIQRRQGWWRIREFRGPFNAEVSERTTAFVRDWLDRENRKTVINEHVRSLSVNGKSR